MFGIKYLGSVQWLSPSRLLNQIPQADLEFRSIDRDSAGESLLQHLAPARKSSFCPLADCERRP